MPIFSCRLTPAAVALSLTIGCAPKGEFPSLAPRPAEKTVGQEVPVRVPLAVPSHPQLLSAIAALLAEAQMGHEAFEAIVPETNTKVSRAAAPGSESWVEAQEAISRLAAVRGPTVNALAQLDLLAIERANQPTNAEDFAVLVEAVERVASLAQRQRVQIDRLRASLKPI